jgi:hypothetical protein
MKHTPGPWTVSIDRFYDRPEVRDKDGRRIAVVVYDFPMGVKTSDANAHLIAAAPELLNVLEELIMQTEKDVTDDIYKAVFLSKDTYIALKKGKEVIAKAKGGTG